MAVDSKSDDGNKEETGATTEETLPVTEQELEGDDEQNSVEAIADAADDGDEILKDVDTESLDHDDDLEFFDDEEEPEEIDLDSLGPYELRDELFFTERQKHSLILPKTDANVEHPYATEITNFEYTPSQFDCDEDIGPVKQLKEFPYEFVTNSVQLIKLAKNLRGENTIGIDLQCDGYKFDGKIAFVQISTKDSDYVIDAHLLRSDLMVLSDVFSNAAIVKVFHDDAGIKTALFQQVLHLYLVNIFEISAALKALKWSPVHLTPVLHEHYNFFHKPYHMRLRGRPFDEVTEEGLRCGSHFMLHFYYTLKSKLLKLDDPEVYDKLLDANRQKCLQLYDDVSDSYFAQVCDEVKLDQHKELVALRAIHQWRREMAKKYNKTCSEILSSHILYDLVQEMSYSSRTLTSITKRNKYVTKYMSQIQDIIRGCLAIGDFKIRKPIIEPPKPPSSKKQQTKTSINKDTTTDDTKSVNGRRNSADGENTTTTDETRRSNSPSAAAAAGTKRKAKSSPVPAKKPAVDTTVKETA